MLTMIGVFVAGTYFGVFIAALIAISRYNDDDRNRH